MSVEKKSIEEKVKAEEPKFEKPEEIESFDIKSCSKYPNSKVFSGMKVEGYWAYSEAQSKKWGALPWPKAHDKPYPGKYDFIAKLENIEAQLRQGTLYEHYDVTEGWSECRVCQDRNGDGEYHLNKYSWPTGYKHYLVSHNVKPSKEFYSFIKALPEKVLEPKKKSEKPS